MTPTPKLRFVVRYTPTPTRVLQQWYEWDIKYPTQKGEWRDVPLEEEK